MFRGRGVWGAGGAQEDGGSDLGVESMRYHWGRAGQERDMPGRPLSPPDKPQSPTGVPTPLRSRAAQSSTMRPPVRGPLPRAHSSMRTFDPNGTGSSTFLRCCQRILERRTHVVVVTWTDMKNGTQCCTTMSTLVPLHTVALPCCWLLRSVTCSQGCLCFTFWWHLVFIVPCDGDGPGFRASQQAYAH